METVFFSISVVVFAAAVVLGLLLAGRKNRKKSFITPMRILLAGVVASTMLLFFPIYFEEQIWNPYGILVSVIMSVYNGIEAIAFGSNYSMMLQAASSGQIEPYYFTFSVVMMFVAPLLAISTVISMFKNISAAVGYVCSYFKDFYVFSALNAGALSLAQDLKRENPKSVVIFTGVADVSFELRQGARNLDAICFKKEIRALNYKFHDSRHSIWFFAIEEHERDNIDDALWLIEHYGDMPNTRLYTFTQSSESGLLLSSAHSKTMKVRRVDLVRSLINGILYEEGVDLFRDAVPVEGGKKQINAVVLGLGDYGTTMVKALSWYCQMDGYRVKIDAFDMDPLAEEKFTVQCPELMSPEYNGVYVPGEAEYTIRIHSGVSVETRRFADMIRELGQTTYVLVCLGSDEWNIQTALDLRMLFERMGIKPKIHAIVYSSDKKRALAGVHNFKGQAYDISFIGDLESTYTEKVILKSKIEADALRRHLRYGAEELFWAHEYNYRSSMALAIRAKAMTECGVPGAGKKVEEMTTEERDTLESLEHRRWNAYMRSEGYIYSGSTERSSRNDLGKMHNDLVSYSELSEEEKRKDSAVASE